MTSLLLNGGGARLRIAVMGDDRIMLRVVPGALSDLGCGVHVLASDVPQADWQGALSQADAIVHLSGAPPMMSLRDSSDLRRNAIDSRIRSNVRFATTLQGLSRPPLAWVHIGSVAYYGNGAAGEAFDEAAPAGEGWAGQVCRLWELSSATNADRSGIRWIGIRPGLLIGKNGGELPAVVLPLLRFGFGGAIGSGRQMLSWFHTEDLARLIVRSVEDRAFSGVYNAAAPDAIRNADLMADLRRATGGPLAAPAPIALVRRIAHSARIDPDALLTNRCVVSVRLRDAGFTMNHVNLADALCDLRLRP